MSEICGVGSDIIRPRCKRKRLHCHRHADHATSHESYAIRSDINRATPDEIRATPDEIRATSNEIRETLHERLANEQFLLEGSHVDEGPPLSDVSRVTSGLTNCRVVLQRCDGLFRRGDGEDGDDLTIVYDSRPKNLRMFKFMFASGLVVAFCVFITTYFTGRALFNRTKFDEVTTSLALTDPKRLPAYDYELSQKLEKIYTDKTGLIDYALESSGGSIIGVYCTRTYFEMTSFANFYKKWFQKDEYHAKSIITWTNGFLAPGQCWRFEGSNACVIIRLSRKILVTGITYEHVANAIDMDSDRKSAPQNFLLYAVSDLIGGFEALLGNFTFDKTGPPLRTFPIEFKAPPVRTVKITVLSNYGNPDYTCLYRFRVHGVEQI